MEDEKRQEVERATVSGGTPTSSVGFVRFNREAKRSLHLFTLCAVALVPLVCVILFLISFFDPYGGMRQVPAVIVNLDKGAAIDGERRNVGQELCDALIEDNSLAQEGEISGFGWSFTSSESDAARALRDGAYYVEMVIPEDFTDSIASANTSDAVKAEIKVYYNSSLGYGVQTVGEDLVARVVDKLNTRVQKDCFKNIFLSMKEAGSDLLSVANAGLDLTNGLFTIRDGGVSLTDGVRQLADGSASLTDGLYEAGDGSRQLADGASRLSGGMNELASGLGQLKKGIEESSSSPEAVALADALSRVGSCLQAYGEEASKEDPDTELEREYLEGAAAAARDAAAANKTIGDPLVAYISGGTFTYASGSTTITSTELGLVPALAAYVEAENALAAFEESELEPLIVLLRELGADLKDVEAISEQLESDVEAYRDAASYSVQCLKEYRAALCAYEKALVDYGMGTITAEELAAFKSAVEAAAQQVSSAYDAVESARKQMQHDLYHIDEFGNPAGLLPALVDAIAVAKELWGQVGSIDRVEEIVNELMILIQAQATAGAAAQGAAGKCEGYLVGVAVTSSYAGGSTAQLADAIGRIYLAVAGGGGSTSLVEGTSQLASGASSLAEGVYTAADGSNVITLNLGTVADGAQSLADGTSTAASTAKTLFDGLLSGKETIDGQTKNSEVRSDVLSSPVAVDDESIAPVANYGTSVAPYYLGLGLWIGCLLATIVLRSLDKRRFLRGDPILSIVARGFVPIAGIALVQMLVAMAVVQFGLNMNVSFPAAYYLVGALAALAFAAINQFLAGTFGLGGQVASVVLLVLQLCVASGAFPVESSLSVFGIASMVMPMTYVVRGLRVAMCGLGAEYVILPSVVLMTFAIGALLLIVAILAVRRKAGRRGTSDGSSRPRGDGGHAKKAPRHGKQRGLDVVRGRMANAMRKAAPRHALER